MTTSVIEEQSLDRNSQPMSQKMVQGRISISEDEIIRFNMELKGVFKDIVDTVEQNQVQAMNGLSHK